MADINKLITTLQYRINEARNKGLKTTTIFTSTLSDCMALLKEQQKDWITDKLPDKPGLYLCTFYGDSIMENYVAPCEYICKPYHAFNKFLPYDYTFGVSEVSRKDLTSDVIAWMPFPEPYKKHNIVKEKL